jgi:flagellar basal-body rod protein FlgG
MINSLWISKTGMEAQQMQLDVISNNLANVSTTGFKRATAVFEDLMYQNLRQVGANSTEQATLPTGLQVGLGVRTVATSRSFAQGNLQQTSNKLDVAIQGDGFFQVTMPDGTTSYTRDGAFQVNSAGAGWSRQPACPLPMESQSRPMPLRCPSRVTAPSPPHPRQHCTPQTSAPSRWRSFINPAGLEPLGAELFRRKRRHRASRQTRAPRAPMALGALMQGFIETSNVNVVQELVTMIQTQRAYEMNSKAIQTSDQMLQKLGQL